MPLTEAEVRSQVISCTRCLLSSVDGITPTPFSGYGAELAICAEAPGAHENSKGEPLIGPAGKKARSWLREAGIDPDSVGYLNVVSCFPLRTPTYDEVCACRPNFTAQVELLKPKAILVLGKVAFGSFWSLPLAKARGLWWVQTIGTHTTYMLATYHPSFALRQPGTNHMMQRDVNVFASGAKLIGSMGHPINPARCAMCGESAVADRAVRLLPFCQDHEPDEVKLQRVFPGAEWSDEEWR